MALLERAGNGRRVRYPTALTMLATAVLGLVDESIQILLPDRFFDIRDVFFNAVAEFMVVAARLAIPPQRRPGWRVWFMWLLATSIGWGWGVYWGWYDNTDPKPLAVPAVLLAGWLGGGRRWGRCRGAAMVGLAVTDPQRRLVGGSQHRGLGCRDAVRRHCRSARSWSRLRRPRGYGHGVAPSSTDDCSLKWKACL